MKLPFDLSPSQLPVIVRRPDVRKVELTDGSQEFEAHNLRYLNLEADRGLFDIGFMLNIRQFTSMSSAERFTLLALQRRLTFSDKLTFPDFRETGKLFSVEGSDGKFVWVTIPKTVIITSSFTVLDLRDECMAIGESEALLENIERAIQDCPDADAKELLKRFESFRPPDRAQISVALTALKTLGIIRQIDHLDVRRRRVEFNMRKVAATRSGILMGMIKAKDLLRRVDGTEIDFSVDLTDAEPPVKRREATSTGKRRKLSRAQYQSMHHKEHNGRIKAEKRLADCEKNGFLTPDQFNAIRAAQDDRAVPNDVRDGLKHAFASARSDPLTEIPEAKAIEKKHAKRR